MNISDVMIHINEPLSLEARSSLEDALRKVEGVVSPRFNAGKEHLLVIAYDATNQHGGFAGTDPCSRLYRPAGRDVNEDDRLLPDSSTDDPDACADSWLIALRRMRIAASCLPMQKTWNQPEGSGNE